jgi:CRP-like cAMP-binding protein
MEIGRSYSRLLKRLDRTMILTEADRNLLAALPLTVTNVAAGARLDHTDQPRCAVVVNGFVCGYKRVGLTRRQITSVFVPGDVAGITGLLLPGSTDVLSALGPAVVAFLPYDALEEMLDSSPRLAQALWRESFIEAAILREWVTSLGRREALARVAHLICEIVVRLRAVDLAKDNSFAICWTQADVADACGISTVHANRTVQELRRLGLVQWDARHLKVRDWDGLAKIGEFSEYYLQCYVRPSDPAHYASDRHRAHM